MHIQQTITPAYIVPTLRLFFIVLAGSIVTLALFVLMAKLIEQDDISVVPVVTPTIGPIVYEAQEEDTRIKTPVKPREETPPPPSVPKAVNPEPQETPNVEWQAPSVGSPSLQINSALGSGMRDQSARPVVQVEPTYPPEAARDGTEGWVRLSFTIDETGNVMDIEIIEAQPKRVFNRAARQALGRWKYQPKVVDGKPQAQPGMQVLLSFNLNSQG